MNRVLNYISVDLVSAVISSASVMMTITMMCIRIGSLGLSSTVVDEDWQYVKIIGLLIAVVNGKRS